MTLVPELNLRAQITEVEFGTSKFGYGFMFGARSSREELQLRLYILLAFDCHFMLGGILGSWPHICKQASLYIFGDLLCHTELCYEFNKYSDVLSIDIIQ
jgi:hypothetical protein